MDSKCTHEAKRSLKDKIVTKDDYLIDEDLEDEMEEEEGSGSGGNGGYADGEKKKVAEYGKRGTSGSGGVVSPPSCQVERCGSDLSEAKKYHKRHKVCELHAKAPVVAVAGLRQRFCQQCSRFHELSEFDEAKRSCRRRLAGHNERRRKTTAEPCGESSTRIGIDGQMKESQCRPAEERGRLQINLPSNPNYKRSQIR